jgi:hypothetical protein
LFPEIAGDPSAALDVAEAMMMLHRRMERAVTRATLDEASESAGGEQASPKPRRWWLFGR